MLNPDEPERVSKEKNVATLSNAIAFCMMENDMPLEYLDKAYADVQRIYRKTRLCQNVKTDKNQHSLPFMACPAAVITSVELFTWKPLKTQLVCNSSTDYLLGLSDVKLQQELVTKPRMPVQEGGEEWKSQKKSQS